MGRAAQPTKAKAVRDLEKRLATALEQQAATSEILRAISTFPTDLQPVLDAIAAGVRGVPAGRGGREESGRHGPRPGPVPEVCRATRRPDLGEESARDGFDLHLHTAADHPLLAAVRRPFRAANGLAIERRGNAHSVL